MAMLDYMIETMQAAKRGEPIQSKHDFSGEWEDDSDPNWNWDCKSFRPKPAEPMELHVNLYADEWKDGIRHRPPSVHSSREEALQALFSGGRYGLFREVVPTPEPAPEPSAVEKRKPLERWINRYRNGCEYVNSSPDAADASASPDRIECIHMIEVLPDEPQKPE